MIKKWLWWGWAIGAFLLVVPCDAVKKNEDSILSDLISKEIIAQLKQGTQIKKKQEQKEYAPGRGKYVGRGYERTNGDIYLLPYWPAYTLFFEDNDLIQFDFCFDTASQAYNGRGSSENLSKLIFGEQSITIKEILLASKELQAGNLKHEFGGSQPEHDISPAHYLSILADQQVAFKASLDQYVGALSYARHFRKGDLTVGFYLPVKIKHQRLSITNDLTQDNVQKLEAVEEGTFFASTDSKSKEKNDNAKADKEIHFFDFYDNLEEFVTEILSRKDISLNKKETVLGLGDVMAYINVDIPSRYFDRIMLGMSVQIPTSNDRDTNKLWDADFGNGGFINLAIYGSFLWQQNRWFNPHAHIKGTYGFDANVNRRVPLTNVYDANTQKLNGISVGSGLLCKDLIFGETLKYIQDVSFSEQDSTVRYFADQAKKVKIHPGAEFFGRLGNTIDAVFSYKGFLDLYYDLHIKGKDYATKRRLDDEYQPGILGHNSWSISHTLGLHYRYQFDAQYRAGLGLFYAIAGRNAPKTFGIDLALNAEF
jgi:hypothetical protein